LRDRHRKSDPFLQSLLATTLGVCLVFFAIGLTYGSELITLPFILTCLGFGLFLVHLPSFVHVALLPAVPPGLLWLAGVILFTLIGLWCPPSLLIICAGFISLVGYLLALASLFLSWHEPARNRTFLLIAALTVMLAPFILGEAWGVYRNPLVIHALAVADTPHQLDPWFQSMLVATIQNYGTPAAGYDGISYLPYHHAVHFVLAALAQFTGAPPIIAVSVGFPLLLMPSFIWLWGGLADALSGLKAWKDRSVTGEAVVIFWVITLIGFGQWLPGPIREMFFLWNSVFQSDSFALGLMVSMALISSALAFYTSPSRQPFVAPPLLTTFAFAAVATVVISWTKVTLVHIPLGVAAFLALRLRGNARICALSAVTGMAAAFFLIKPFFIGSFSEPLLRFQFLGFWKKYLEPDTQMIYPIVAMFWGLVFCALYLRSARIVTLSDLTSGLRGRALLPAEIILTISILGILPGLLLGGALSFNIMYYEETARLTGLLATAALAVTLPLPLNAIKFGQASLMQAFVLVLLPFALILTMSNVAPKFLGAAKSNTVYRGSSFAVPFGIENEESKPRISDVIRSGNLIEAARLLRDNLTDTEKTAFASGSWLGELLLLNELPRDEKSKSLLFVSRSHPVWKLAAKADHLNPYVAMLPVGISGVALIDGTPIEGTAEKPIMYGFRNYTAPEFIAESAYDEDLLLDRARARGFSRVIALRENNEGRYVTEVIPAAMAKPDLRLDSELQN
jgi:hypothetical protein